MSTRRGISLSTENFVYCSRNVIFCACEISRSFADHPSKILISKVDKFYTGFITIIQKNRHVRTLERRLLGLLGGVSQESDKVIWKSNGKQTGPYLVSHVSIIFVNFFLIKKG